MTSYTLIEHRGTTLVDDCELAWRERGSGPPVLFIHGTAASVWGELFARAAESYTAISYHRRGFGESKHVPIAALSPHAQDAAALLDARGARPAVVVGWSIGGVIAAELAIRYPMHVAGLVLLEPPLWAKKHVDLNLINGVVGSILLGLALGPRRGGMRFSRWVFRERTGGNGLDSVDPSIRVRIGANAAAIGVEIRGGTGEHLPAAELARIKVPTEVLASGRGQRFLLDGAERMANAIPNARFTVLEDASHFLHLERLDAVLAAIGRVQAQTGYPTKS